MREKKPVSRAGNSWLARVYRGEWVGSRSFADRDYGSRELAQATAQEWVKMADSRLPVIPLKPALKRATFHIRKNRNGRYYDIYLPRPGKSKPEFRHLSCNNLRDMEEKAKAAHKLVEARNAQLSEAYQLSYAGWKRQRDKIMQEILKTWKELR